MYEIWKSTYKNDDSVLITVNRRGRVYFYVTSAGFPQTKGFVRHKELKVKTYKGLLRSYNWRRVRKTEIYL